MNILEAISYMKENPNKKLTCSDGYFLFYKDGEFYQGLPLTEEKIAWEVSITWGMLISDYQICEEE